MVVLILRWGAFVTLAILMASFSAFAQSPQVQRLGGDQGELKFIFAPPEGASSIPEAFFLTAKGGAVAGPRIRVTQLSRESAQLPTRAVTFRFPARTATLRPDVATPVAVDFDPEILSNAGTYTGRLVVEEKVGKNALPRLVLNFTVTRPDAKLKIVPESPTVVLKRLCPFLCGSLYLTDVFRVDLWTFDASARIRGITPARLSSSTDGITDGRITATLGGPNSTGEISVGKPQALELVVQGLSRAGKYEGTLVIQGDGLKEPQAIKATVIVTDRLLFLALAVGIGVGLSFLLTMLVRWVNRDKEWLALNRLRRRVDSMGNEVDKWRLTNRLDEALEALLADDIDRAREIRVAVQSEYDKAAPPPSVPGRLVALELGILQARRMLLVMADQSQPPKAPLAALVVVTSEDWCMANTPIWFEILDPDPTWDSTAWVVWDFGDGTTRRSRGPERLRQSHAYTYPGSYEVKLPVPGNPLQAQVQVRGDVSDLLVARRKVLDAWLSFGAFIIGVVSGMVVQSVARPEYFGTSTDYLLAIFWGVGLDRGAKFEQVRKIFVRG